MQNSWIPSHKQSKYETLVTLTAFFKELGKTHLGFGLNELDSLLSDIPFNVIYLFCYYYYCFLIF